ncbi:MAG: xanthine dehydrogenase family protein molybdopterin-binding subunit [Gemmatimonadota bacterium]|nr:xanthine dehydrogenase family protein molybdopterin-binding subunit [Gemmatimonadota bacterium]MDH3478441.1 xanthine dehydrogenase family protein molybdopterin-binding subunit [Gemmatimonadota bacterium]MDH3569231.1 xanthine dehydrogenase family protein molybdopterin-binding subunit [Gemmatimonadota bacterium]MDH5551327.1 xanthine dehydrogenase family protein molybdopterin-binding subunit [Gemmatimonadota bacterium]
MTAERDERYWEEGLDIPQTPAPSSDPEPWKETRIVGTPRPRVDAYERVSGTAVYPSDVMLPQMLYGAILRSPHANAVVKGVDVSRAEALPGVRAVISAFTPTDRSIRGHETLLREDLFVPHCRFEGEVVAAVAADTPYQAADAVRAIAVEYDVLPFLADERRALDSDAPLVHETGNRVSAPGRYSRGDVEGGFAEADVVLEREYRTEAEIHTPMELHGCVARWDGDALTLWESTQGVFSVQAQVASSLGMPLSKVRVVGHYVGGGFGSKLQPGKYTLIAALLAKQTARPVKLFLTREESYLTVGNRPPNNMRLKAGVKRDGTLTALDFYATGTGGAYRAGGTGALDWLIRDLYACANVRIETQDLYINAGPARPFRAPGHPQCAWALEQLMDEMADAIGMDPVDLRLKNVPTVSQGRGNAPYTTTGLAACIEEGAKAFGWREARSALLRQPADAAVRRGVGMAAGLWVAGGGGPPSTAIVKLFADGSVNLNMGASDIGTGTKTVMAMVVAEELGVDPDAVQIEHADTGSTPYATGSGGSKTVPTESPAVRAAALDVKRQVLDIAAEEMEVAADTLAMRDGKIVSTADPPAERPIAELRGLRARGTVTGVGYRGPNPEGKAVNPFAAQFCELEVNLHTGEVRILRFLGAHDSGRVMNRLTYQNQVFGGITMGIGLAMTEERVLDVDQTGKMVNINWHDYKIPTALDVPADMMCVPIDRPDDEANTTGAKGIGEPATIPTAPAIANAITHAVGVRVTSTPATPARVVQLLADARKGG